MRVAKDADSDMFTVCDDEGKLRAVAYTSEDAAVVCEALVSESKGSSAQVKKLAEFLEGWFSGPSDDKECPVDEAIRLLKEAYRFEDDDYDTIEWQDKGELPSFDDMPSSEYELWSEGWSEVAESVDVPLDDLNAAKLEDFDVLTADDLICGEVPDDKSKLN